MVDSASPVHRPRFAAGGAFFHSPVNTPERFAVTHSKNARDLAALYGGKLCFHGSIDTQHTPPFGTPDDVRNEVPERVETFKPDGGFTIAPPHHLMTDISVANIVALHDAAWEYF